MVCPLIDGFLEVLNAFPSKDGISDILSPAEIIEGTPKFDFSKNIISFGTWTIVRSTTTNDMKTMSVLAIALRRYNNSGGNYFIILRMCKRIHGHHWDNVPIDKNVIEYSESMTKKKGQPTTNRGLPCFEQDPIMPISDLAIVDENIQLTISNIEESTEKSESQLAEY